MVHIVNKLPGTSAKMRIKKRNRQYGQAMTEFVVMGLIMVPLFLAVLYMGKYVDAKQTAIQASRYAVWERAIDLGGAGSKSNAQIEQEMEVRIIGNQGRNGGVLQSTDMSQTGSTNDGDYNPLWFDASGKRMMTSLTDAKIVGGIKNGAIPTTTATSQLTNLFGKTEAKWMKLNTNGWLQADVNIPLLNIANFAPLSNINFAAGSTTVMLSDAWNAGGSKDVAQKVKAAAPVSMVFGLPAVQAGLSLLKFIITPIEPSFQNFYPGCISPDVVPTDRLPNFSNYASCTY